MGSGPCTTGSSLRKLRAENIISTARNTALIQFAPDYVSHGQNVVDMVVRRGRALVHSFFLTHSFSLSLSLLFFRSLSLSLILFAPDVAHASIKRTGFKHAPCTAALARVQLLHTHFSQDRYDGVVDAPIRTTCGGLLILFNGDTFRPTGSTMRVRIWECTRRPCDGTAETSVDVPCRTRDKMGSKKTSRPPSPRTRAQTGRKVVFALGIGSRIDMHARLPQDCQSSTLSVESRRGWRRWWTRERTKGT